MRFEAGWECNSPYYIALLHSGLQKKVGTAAGGGGAAAAAGGRWWYVVEIWKGNEKEKAKERVKEQKK